MSANNYIIVTGAAGFIGSEVAKALLIEGKNVIGIDNMNNYYEPSLKHHRTQRLEKYENFRFHKVNIANSEQINNVITTYGKENISDIIHLAAQAGVRYSLTEPFKYVESNLIGHMVMLELARNLPNLDKFIYASSSSVYGANEKIPFSVDDRTDQPISLYAATKKADELMTYSYASLYGIRAIGLRFFTVYGPWGRPDMAYFSFAQAIFNNQPIRVFNNGEMMRDFTYISDIIDGVLACRDVEFNANSVPSKIYNLGNNRPEKLMDMIAILEQACGKKAIIEFEGMQKGDVKQTYADIDSSKQDLGYLPKIPLREGIPVFIDWFKEYYDEK